MTLEYLVEDVVPHSGKMSLLSRIVDHGEDWLSAEVDIRQDSLFSNDKGVPAWVGLEYLAQAIGAFAGLQERRSGGFPKVGFLLGSRKYTSSNDYFLIGSTLSIRVTKNLQAENGLSAFDCTLFSDSCEASARLNVFQPKDANQFIKDAKSE